MQVASLADSGGTEWHLCKDPRAHGKADWSSFARTDLSKSLFQGLDYVVVDIEKPPHMR